MPFKAVQGHQFRYKSKPICDFLVNNTNLHLIWHRFCDIYSIRQIIGAIFAVDRGCMPSTQAFGEFRDEKFRKLRNLASRN